MFRVKKNKPKVVIGMSGGVDSAVAAYLLLQQGYDVIGVFMQFWFPAGETYGENRCCSLESFNLAKEVADNLGIKIHKLNVGSEFKEKIVDEFLSDYEANKTPNPCVACNKYIKFDLFLKKALTIFDADFIATGHYVELGRKFSISDFRLSKSIRLLRGRDKNKDQSYFLYNLDQEALKNVLFPLGKYNKIEIRKIAKKLNMPVHAKRDSQEVCFVGQSHTAFLKKYLDLKSGKIVDEQGKILGNHEGLQLYAMGQRKNIKLPDGPWYVSAIDKNRNLLVVTKNPEKSKMFAATLQCEKLNWVSGEPKFPLRCTAQIRYRAKAEKCVVSKDDNGIKVEFDNLQRAMAPGQSVVFYHNQEVLGGGIIK